MRTGGLGEKRKQAEKNNIKGFLGPLPGEGLRCIKGPRAQIFYYITKRF